jgi:hypothetical protein
MALQATAVHRDQFELNRKYFAWFTHVCVAGSAWTDGMAKGGGLMDRTLSKLAGVSANAPTLAEALGSEDAASEGGRDGAELAVLGRQVAEHKATICVRLCFCAACVRRTVCPRCPASRARQTC